MKKKVVIQVSHKMSQKLRYEFYLPTQYNDKTSIEKSKFRQIKNKIKEKFKGISVHPGTIDGEWINAGSSKTLKDSLVKFEVCVDGSITNQLFFENLKEELKNLFDQEDIYMVYTEINLV